MDNCIAALQGLAGTLGFHLLTLCCLCAKTLDSANITEACRLWIFEHKPRSTTLTTKYLHNRVKVDVLGLLCHNTQRSRLVRGRGVTKVTYFQLTCKDELL